MDRHLIEQHREPLIGLQYVTEYKANEGNVYWCNLCESSCQSVHLLIGHVSGRQHRIKYMQKHYVSYIQMIQASQNEAALLIEYSRIIEQGEGRHSIVSNSDLDLSTFLQYTGITPTAVVSAAATNAGQDASKPGGGTGGVVGSLFSTPVEDQRQPFEDTPITELLHKLAMRSGFKNVTELLQPHMKHLITNEEEAAKALEVANFLTKAVLNYRLAS